VNINLHIENLILNGVSAEETHHPEISTAIQSELAHLLSNNESPLGLLPGKPTHSIQGGNISFEPNQNPKTLGRKVAGAVYQGLRK